MKNEKVADKIKLAEEVLKDLRADFRKGYVMQARRKCDWLKEVAGEIEGAIQEAHPKRSAWAEI